MRKSFFVQKHTDGRTSKIGARNCGGPSIRPLGSVSVRDNAGDNRMGMCNENSFEKLHR